MGNNILVLPKGRLYPLLCKLFKENNINSIKIDLKMLDRDKVYNMETIYSGTMEKFAEMYTGIKFKCTKIDYHENGKIKYLLIEQITTE